MQRNDCVLDALGPGQYNDLLLAYYQANGGTSADINDAEYEFLVAQGVTPAQLQDMWYELLTTLGFTGALTDMMWSFWCEEGGIVSVPSGYDFSWDQTDINDGNVTAITATTTGCEIGADWTFTATSDGGGTPVVESGTVDTSPSFQIGPMDMSLLGNGTVTGSLVLTNYIGSGTPAEQTITKTTTP